MKNLYLSFIAICLSCTLAQAQSVQVNYNQIDFETITYGNSESILVEVTNLLNEEITLSQPEFFDIYNSSPFSVIDFPETIEANGTASFSVVYEPVHNIAHNSEMVIKTSGNRGALAIDLLGDCNYSNTYYNATHDLMDEDLEDAFENFLDDNYDDFGYDSARDKIFMELDNQKVNGQGSSENRLTRSYIGTDAVGYTSRSNAQSQFSLNTEHTFPQGFFSSNLPMKADMHHLYVTDVNANSTRANYAFGTVANVVWQQGGSKQGTNASGTNVFEPRDAHKGKAARAVLYFVLRYQNYGGFLTASQEQTLREWCELYPPTEVDIARNNGIFALQHNRNPFVDYPQFTDRIYNFRLDQNRPNIGYLSVSTEDVAFGDVSATGDEVYNIVLTNYGERFITVSNIEFTENTTSSFDFDGGAPGNLLILPGESVYLPVVCTALSSSEDLEATLNVQTTASNISVLNIPVTADFSTGLSEKAAYADIVVSPNPFTDNVEISNLNQSISGVKVYDISGRICASQSGDLKTISMSELHSGLYQMVVTLQNGDVFVRKVVKR